MNQEVKMDNKTWHLRFNRWTYGEYYKPPNFCPYFWKTLLAVVILPLVALGKGIWYIVEQIPEFDTPEWHISSKNIDRISTGVKTTLLAGLPVILGLLAVYGQWEVLAIIFGAVGIAFGVLGIIFGIACAWDYYRERHPKEIKPKVYKEHVPNMTVVKAKSWYHKNCPMIQYT